MKRTIFLGTLVLTACYALFADIAPEPTPRSKTKSIDSSLSIRLDNNAKEATLRIPKSQLKQLRAEIQQLDDDSDNTAALTGISRTQMIVSGVFLSLAFVFGGFWFARSGRSRSSKGKTIAAIFFVVGIASVSTFVYANAGPPSAARSITGKMFSDAVHLYKSGYGKIKLEVKADDRGGVELIVPDTPRDNKTRSEEE